MVDENISSIDMPEMAPIRYIIITLRRKQFVNYHPKPIFRHSISIAGKQRGIL